MSVFWSVGVLLQVFEYVHIFHDEYADLGRHLLYCIWVCVCEEQCRGIATCRHASVACRVECIAKDMYTLIPPTEQLAKPVLFNSQQSIFSLHAMQFATLGDKRYRTKLQVGRVWLHLHVQPWEHG